MSLLPVLQEAVPNTVNYLILGYTVLIGLPLLYIGSWFVRRRNLERDIELIETLQQEQQPEPDRAPAHAAADR